MVHAQKPDFLFRRKGRVHLNRRGASVQSTTGSRAVCISGSNAGYTMFCSNVKGTGYPLHSSVSTSLPLPCVTVCHHVSTAVYKPQTKASLSFVPVTRSSVYRQPCTLSIPDTRRRQYPVIKRTIHDAQLSTKSALRSALSVTLGNR